MCVHLDSWCASRILFHPDLLFFFSSLSGSATMLSLTAFNLQAVASWGMCVGLQILQPSSPSDLLASQKSFACFSVPLTPVVRLALFFFFIAKLREMKCEFAHCLIPSCLQEDWVKQTHEMRRKERRRRLLLLLVLKTAAKALEACVCVSRWSEQPNLLNDSWAKK